MNISYYTYPWAMDVAGGGERQMMAYRAHLRRHGIDVHLFDMWHPNFDDTSVLHSFSVMPGTVELCDYAKKRGLKLVISPNLWVTKETKKDYPFDTIWNLFELADCIVVNSNMEIQALSDIYSISESKFKVVYNAAETDYLLPEDPDLFANTYGIHEPYILNIANIEPRKNQLRFLEVLRQERPDLTFVVIGGIRDKAYAQKCHEVSGKGFICIPPLPYASPMLRSALSGCVFFAMPSLLETPSIAALEAAALGARILLTDQGTTTEYFGDSVVYVSPLSETSLVSGIHTALEVSPERSTWVARDSFLWPKVIPQLVQVYKSLLEGD